MRITASGSCAPGRAAGPHQGDDLVALRDAARIAATSRAWPRRRLPNGSDRCRDPGEYLEQGWNAEKQAYVGAYGSHHLDARGVARGPVRRPRSDGAAHAGDLAAVERELGVGDLIYRNRMDDGLEGDEGTFTACAFWRVGCLALGGGRPSPGRFRAADRPGQRCRAARGEIDPATGAQRGNMPQGFSHMALINAALRLESSIARFGADDGADAMASAAE